MTIIFDSTRPVQTTQTFGRGISRQKLQPFTQADLDWAAQFFGDLESDRELEERYQQFRYDAQFDGTFPQTGHCLCCGDRCDDLTKDGLCDACDTNATNSGIACQNLSYCGQYRVF
jgi:hypothetical protein